MRRGVRIRSVYEQSALDDPALEPYLSKWIAAGEEARFYDGELSHKLAVFDRQSVLMPLVAPSGQGSTLFIRHPQLAMSLGMLFDSFWERGKSFPASRARRTKDKEVTKTAAATSKLLLTPRRRSTNSQPHFLGQKVHSRTKG